MWLEIGCNIAVITILRVIHVHTIGPYDIKTVRDRGPVSSLISYIYAPPLHHLQIHLSLPYWHSLVFDSEVAHHLTHDCCYKSLTLCTSSCLSCSLQSIMKQLPSSTFHSLHKYHSTSVFPATILHLISSFPAKTWPQHKPQSHCYKYLQT